jgi:hypothetical protein
MKLRIVAARPLWVIAVVAAVTLATAGGFIGTSLANIGDPTLFQASQQ